MSTEDSMNCGIPSFQLSSIDLGRFATNMNGIINDLEFNQFKSTSYKAGFHISYIFIPYPTTNCLAWLCLALTKFGLSGNQPPPANILDYMLNQCFLSFPFKKLLKVSDYKQYLLFKCINDLNASVSFIVMDTDYMILHYQIVISNTIDTFESSLYKDLWEIYYVNQRIFLCPFCWNASMI